MLKQGTVGTQYYRHVLFGKAVLFIEACSQLQIIHRRCTGGRIVLSHYGWGYIVGEIVTRDARVWRAAGVAVIDSNCSYQ